MKKSLLPILSFLLPIPQAYVLLVGMVLVGCGGKSSSPVDSSTAKSLKESSSSPDPSVRKSKALDGVSPEVKPRTGESIKKESAAENKSAADSTPPSNRLAVEQQDLSWMAKLADIDEHARAAAQDRVDELEDARGALLSAMKHRNAAVRRGAAFYLADRFHAQDAGLVAAFGDALRDDDALVRSIAAGVVLQFPVEQQKEALPDVLRILKSPSEKTALRVKASQIIAGANVDPMWKSAAFLADMVQLMRQDRDVRVRIACMFVVAKAAPADMALRELRSILQSPTTGSSNREVRLAAIGRLASLGSSAAGAVNDLAKILNESDEAMAEAAAAALARLGSAAIGPLMEKLESGRAKTRGLAAQALGRMGGVLAGDPKGQAEAALKKLHLRLKDDDEQVRETARQAMEAILAEL